MLSRRATNTYLKSEEFLMKSFMKCYADPYCQQTNQDGMVNLGTAINQLCEDIISEKLNETGIFEHQPSWQHYFGLNGTPDFLQTLADFLTRKFTNDEDPLSKENIRVVNGVSSSLEALAWSLCDPGDIILTALPTYSRFFADMQERVEAKVIGVHLSDEDDFELRPELFEQEILLRKEKGEVVRGILLCNPHNPLGKVYSRDLVMEFIDLCTKYDLHLLVDEVYALSVFDSTPFTSILSIPREEIPNPNLIHFLWGLSKDFGLAGFRTGVIHTYNKDLLKSLDGMSIFTSLPAHIQQVSVKLLGDQRWIDDVYIPTNHARLRESLQLVKTMLGDLNLRFIRPSAGLFCWIDFSAYLKKSTKEEEIAMFERLFEKGKVYIVPGTEFGCIKPGWFRIIFTVNPDVLKEGLRRIKEILMSSG